MFDVVCRALFVVCCVFGNECCLLFVVCMLLLCYNSDVFVVCYRMLVVCCLLCDVRVNGCLILFAFSLFVVRCYLFVVGS